MPRIVFPSQYPAHINSATRATHNPNGFWTGPGGESGAPGKGTQVLGLSHGIAKAVRVPDWQSERRSHNFEGATQLPRLVTPIGRRLHCVGSVWKKL